MHQNIQQLFAMIPAANVMAYLERSGWQRIAHQDEAVAIFGSPDVAAAEPCCVRTFTSESHPHFRQQLPNLIFAVCLFEDRPALDIANEMYALQVALAAPDLATRATAWQRTVIYQQRNAELYIWMEPSSVSFDWHHGDRLEVLVRGESEPPRFALRDDGLLIQEGVPGQFRAFLGCEPPVAGSRPTVRGIFLAETARLSEFDLPADRNDFLARLEPILARIEFDLPTSRPDDGLVAPETARRQIALIAAAYVKIVRLTPHAQAVLWRIAQRLAAGAGLCLEAHAMSLEDLWLTAVEDSAEFPRGTLQWLEQHAVDPRQLQSAG